MTGSVHVHVPVVFSRLERGIPQNDLAEPNRYV